MGLGSKPVGVAYMATVLLLIIKELGSKPPWECIHGDPVGTPQVASILVRSYLDL